MIRLVYSFLAICQLPGLAFAQCQSHADNTAVDYVEYREARYAVCYSREYPDDLEVVKCWLSRAFELGRSKYGVASPLYNGKEFRLTAYFPPRATGRTSQGYVQMACCYDDREGGDIVHAEIHYLTPSAWRGELLGGLGQPPEYYHPHYITHEAVHFFQYACCRTEARARGYRPPSWITEGMAESDGYRHTTEYSRSTGIEKLNKRVLEREVDSVVYGQNLLSEQALVVSSVYWAGGWVMNYLAERYGDEIHVEMLGHNLPEILSKRGTSIERTFHEMAALVRSMRPEVSQPGGIVRARHLMEIRRTIEAQLPSGVSCGPWTDDPIVPGVTPVKATHINEIRGCLERILSR